MRELYEQPDEETAWLVDGLLPTSGTSFFVAKPKVGKSVTVQNLAVAVAQGERFLDRSTTQGIVLYCALEEKPAEVKQHLRGLGAHEDDPLYIYVAAAPENAMTWLNQAAQTYSPALIIVDTWHRLTRVSDVNDYAAVNNAMEPLVSLARESGAHLAFTHHGRKGDGAHGDNVLGSTALFGAVDTLVEMRRSERRTLWSIQRYGEDMPESVIEMDLDTFRVSLTGTRQAADEQTIAVEMKAFLAEHAEPVSREAIEAAVEARTGVKRAALQRLVERGEVQREGDGRKGKPYLYSCSLVPGIYAEQENMNGKTADVPRVVAENDCSRTQSLPSVNSGAFPVEQLADPANSAFSTVDDDRILLSDIETRPTGLRSYDLIPTVFDYAAWSWGS